MASVMWTGKRMQDPSTSFSEVFQAKVNGQSVGVTISAEALQDYGEAQCKAVAVQKIEAEVKANGRSLTESS